MRLWPLLLLGATLQSYAQFPQTRPGGTYPGQYPPSGQPLPGGTLPGRSRAAKKVDTSVPTDTLAGILRKISEGEIALEPADKRIVRVIVGKTAKFVTTDNTGKSVPFRSADLEPGDHITIDAVRDERKYLIAVQVRFDKKGTAVERKAASQPLEDLISTGAAAEQAGDDDRPRLRRGDDTREAPKNPPAPAAAEPAEPGRPATTMAPSPAPKDDDDPGPPILRRNRTLARRSESPAVEPGPIVPIPAQESRPVTTPQIVDADPIPTPVTPPEDAVISAAREAANSFTETLPNYVVKQMTTRYQTEAAAGKKTSWHAMDLVSADLLVEAGKETYKNILVNGKTPKQALEKSGSWSNGEFASILQLVLLPASDADFHGKRSTTMVNRSAWRYDYSVEQSNSHWTLEAAGQSYSPAYSGAIWIDKESSRVLRIEMIAQRIPTDFPLDSGESAVDYDFVLLGDRKFLVPVHSEVLSCQRGTRDCSRNVIDYRNYRKFGADSAISFEKDPR